MKGHHHDEGSLEAVLRQVALPRDPGLPPEEPQAHGSRRRRLWELDGHAHCPVVGVCLPIAALRRVVDKVLGGQTLATDYDLHCGVVADCKQRTRTADAVQRELDRRYMARLRQVAKAKTADALEAWWDDAQKGHDIAGALWAALTHPRCGVPLENRILAQVHMLQHQAGAAVRVDHARFAALSDEHAALSREVEALRRRAQRDADDGARRVDALAAETAALRAQLVAADEAARRRDDQWQALQQSVPDLTSRVELAAQVDQQAERIRHLEQALQEARQAAAWPVRPREAETPVEPASPVTEPSAPEPEFSALQLDHRDVLCVGGRPAAVPLYRRVVERTGARFLHHDGGSEDGIGRLDASIAAADLVICQTGCISHDAYWRVKDHCKRTGKRCLYVETPSAAALERALRTLAQTE